MEINSKARAFFLIDKIKQSRMLWSGQKDVTGPDGKKDENTPCRRVDYRRIVVVFVGFCLR